jgi:aldose sugar dehydrogenase
MLCSRNKESFLSHRKHFAALWLVTIAILLATVVGLAQQRPAAIGIAHPSVPSGPLVFDTAEQHKIRVSVVASGLQHPWAVALLPDGNILVSERPGRLRIIRDGVLDPQPLAGVPKVHAVFHSGLLDVVLHPNFAENKLVYFTYTKPGENGKFATALGRGRYDKTGLLDVQDVFVGEPTNMSGGSRIAFGLDGLIYMTTGAASPVSNLAQDPNSDYGKVLRLRDDGTIPPDNPFVGRAGSKPEVYSMGHRDHMGLTVQPGTGTVLNGEEGPVGGDKVNVILPGRNYGWPLYSYGRQNDSSPIPHPYRDGIEPALITWQPGITPSGMTFYTGDRFPAWKGNLFVGGLRRGEIPGTGSVERIVFNDKMWELRRESLLTDLHLRIRDVRQGPDGLLYVLTDEEDGVLLKIEPAP